MVNWIQSVFTIENDKGVTRYYLRGDSFGIRVFGNKEATLEEIKSAVHQLTQALEVATEALQIVQKREIENLEHEQKVDKWLQGDPSQSALSSEEGEVRRTGTPGDIGTLSLGKLNNTSGSPRSEENPSDRKVFNASPQECPDCGVTNGFHSHICSQIKGIRGNY